MTRALSLFVLVLLAACGEPSPDFVLKPVSFNRLPGWSGESHLEAWSVVTRTCQGRSVPDYCRLPPPADDVEARERIETYFEPFMVNRGESGLFTGYYEPVYPARRKKEGEFYAPVYGLPRDVIVLNLRDFRADLPATQLVGRIEGRKVVPYATHAEINASPPPAETLAWMKPTDRLFMQIQGSGTLVFEDGSSRRLGYAGKNGHPYVAIGRTLVEQGEMTLRQVSMQSIRQWLDQNPERGQEIRESNPSFVFFAERITPAPTGSLGVELKAERSLAVDPEYIPLGSLLWVSTNPIKRLMRAEDTGGAIKGAIRGDIFFGRGDEAGEKAGRFKEEGRYYLLLPRKGAETRLAEAAS